MERRIPVRDLRPGDFLVRVNGRDVNARITAIEPVTVGQAVRGPRGGLYHVTAAGARDMVVLATDIGARPVVRTAGTATVYIQEPTS
jgi:hypothetical protein